MTTPIPTPTPGAVVKLSQQTANIVGIVLTVMVSVQLLGISAALVFIRTIPTEAVQLLTVILTASTTCLATMVGWCFAGSAQSSTNADTLNKQAAALGETQRVIADVRQQLKDAPAGPSLERPQWVNEAEWSAMPAAAQKAAAAEWAGMSPGQRMVAAADISRLSPSDRAKKVAQYAPAAGAADPITTGKTP